MGWLQTCLIHMRGSTMIALWFTILICSKIWDNLHGSITIPYIPMGIQATPWPFTIRHHISKAKIMRTRKDKTAMSEVRIAIEWLSPNDKFIIMIYFRFVNFKKSCTFSLSPVEKILCVCALLQNTHTCLYGNEVDKIFGIQSLTLQENVWWRPSA